MNNPGEEKQRKTKALNPEFEGDKEGLAIATFGVMVTLVKNRGQTEFPDNNWGYVDGYLKKDIGPIKAGTYVQLNNNEDLIIVNIVNDREESVEVYSFRVILQEPIIVEEKDKM
jgi:hypothetical protein